MKELQTHTGDKVKAIGEIRQVIKTRRYMGKLRLQPGQKVYEMICVPGKDGDIVKGVDPLTGVIDPDFTEVIEAKYEAGATAVLGTPVASTDDSHGIRIALGPVKPGIRRKLIVTDGNLYMEAINPATARKKMIAQFFPKQFIGQLTVQDFIEIAEGQGLTPEELPEQPEKGGTGL